MYKENKKQLLLRSSSISDWLQCRYKDMKMKALLAPTDHFCTRKALSDSFLATRKLLHHIQRSGKQAVFLKVDFTKVFDSINWGYLLTVLRAKGFSHKWICWIDQLLSSSSSGSSQWVFVRLFHSQTRPLTRGPTFPDVIQSCSRCPTEDVEVFQWPFELTEFR
jgi:Reverse transcriptase (RNA-dependent DNA polymerase)